MKDTILAIVAIAGIFVVLPIAILWLRDKIVYRQLAPEERKAAAERFRDRLRCPDLGAIEAHFGHPVPAPLRELYGNLDEIMRSDIEVLRPDDSDPVYICFYNPADGENLHSIWPGCEQYYAFANDGAGNELLVDPRLDDPPVLFHDHETGEIETITKSLAEFMRWKRRPVDE